jgi:hypothetical protein
MELAQPQGDGHTLREHYEAAARQDPAHAQQLEGPDLPELYAWAWRAFLELDRTRGPGPAPIAYADMEAWARLTGCKLSPEDVALIVELDQLGFRIRAEHRKAR